MSPLADMTRQERQSWLNYHGLEIATLRANFEAAAERYATGLAKCNGVFERSTMSAADFVSEIMEAADAPLAEEVRDDLGV